MKFWKYIKISTLITFAHKKVIKETLWSVVTKAFSFVLFFAINIYIARNLSVSEFGSWSFVLSTLTVVFTLSYFGINGASKKFLAQHNYTESIQQVIISSVYLRLIVSITFTLAYAGLCWIGFAITQNTIWQLLFVGAPLILFSGIVEFCKDVFIGLHRSKYNLLINVSEFGFKLGLLVIFFQIFEANVLTIIFTYIIALGIASVIGLFWVFQYKKVPLQKLFMEDRLFVRSIFRYSLPLIVISLGFIITTELDILMITWLSDTTETGIYSVSKQIAQKLPQIALAISMGVMPIFAKITRENVISREEFFHKLLWWNAILYGGIGLSVVVTSNWLVPAVYGNAYQASAPVLNVLMLYTFLFSFTLYLSSFLDYQGLAKKRAINLSIVTLGNIILNLILIPRFGAIGAAWGTTISFFPYIFLNYREVALTFRAYEK